MLFPARRDLPSNSDRRTPPLVWSASQPGSPPLRPLLQFRRLFFLIHCHWCTFFSSLSSDRLTKFWLRLTLYSSLPDTTGQKSVGVSSEGTVMGERELIHKDKLILRGLQFHGFHGVKHEEKNLGQKFVVDVDAWLDLTAACESDCIEDTVSYTEIYRIVKDVVEGPSQNLLESVAHLIASTTLLEFPQICAVRVKVGKPHVAVRGVVDYLGVEIFRYRKA